MQRIFLSYAPTIGPLARRLYDALAAAFGADALLGLPRDVPPGVDRRDDALRRVAAAQAVLVVIGRTWLNDLAAPSDLQRLCIEAALAQSKLVIPVLVGGAFMPEPQHLPLPLQPLAFRQPLNLRDDPDFTNDVAYLIGTLQQTFLAQQRTPAQSGYTPPPAPAMRPQTPPSSPERVVVVQREGRGCLGWIGRIVGSVLSIFTSLIGIIAREVVRSTVSIIISAIVGLLFITLVGWFVITFLQNNLDAAQALQFMREQAEAVLRSLLPSP